jgi:hypothetical protein
MSPSPETSLRYPIGWFLGALLVLILFAVIAYTSYNVASNTTTYDQEQAQKRYALLAKQRADDQKALTALGWVDQGKGIITIPVDEAMTRELDDLKAKPVQAGQEIPGAMPPAPATPAATPATNAPAAQPAAATNAPAATPATSPAH